MRSSTFYSSVLLCTAVVSAWPSFPEAHELVERGRGALGIRDDASSTSFDLTFSGSEGQVATSTSQSTTASASTTASDTDSSASQSITASASSGGSTSNSISSATTTTPTQTSFDPRLGPGGISMISPNPTSPSTYYKIKDQITFAWNYTSVSILPSAVDILAVGASNRATWTLALNQSVSGPTQAFTWDTGEFQSTATVPLLTESYTLVVYDAAKEVTAVPSAGYLGTANQFVFGMYLPSPYTEWNEWKCVTCSGADSAMERRTMGFVVGMAAITVLSFTWFSGVAGLW